MNARHTPGPWAFLPDINIVGAPSTWHDEDGAHHDLRYPHVIAEIPDDWDQSTHGPLIAAAPELLDLAYQYLSDLRRPPQGDSLQRRIERAEAIIAKTQGQ